MRLVDIHNTKPRYERAKRTFCLPDRDRDHPLRFYPCSLAAARLSFQRHGNERTWNSAAWPWFQKTMYACVKSRHPLVKLLDFFLKHKGLAIVPAVPCCTQATFCCVHIGSFRFRWERTVSACRLAPDLSTAARSLDRGTIRCMQEGVWCA